MDNTSGIDLQLVLTLSNQLVNDVLGEKEIEKEIHVVNLELPKKLVQIFEHISERSGRPLHETLSKAATKGIERYLEDLRKMGINKISVPEIPQVTTPPDMSALGGDFEKRLTEVIQAMSQIKNVAEQLAMVQEQFEKAENNESGDSSDNEGASGESSLVAGESAGEG